MRYRPGSRSAAARSRSRSAGTARDDILVLDYPAAGTWREPSVGTITESGISLDLTDEHRAIQDTVR